MKRRSFVVLGGIILILLMIITSMGNVFAAPPDYNSGKNPANFSKIVFVHYPKGYTAKGGIPGAPGGGSGGSSGSDKQWYKYNGIHWAESDLPVYYKVNSGISSSFLSGIQASFQTWEDDPNSYIDFEYDHQTFSGVPSSFDGSGYMNGDNEVGWTSLAGSYPNAIAVTLVWYNRFTGLIAEVDMAMNQDLPWSQTSLPSGVDPDTVTGNLGTYDVQNIATHEAGHWLMLGDMYNKSAGDQTMYGYGAKGELKKRSLESGDLAGVQSIYSSP